MAPNSWWKKPLSLRNTFKIRLLLVEQNCFLMFSSCITDIFPSQRFDLTILPGVLGMQIKSNAVYSSKGFYKAWMFQRYSRQNYKQINIMRKLCPERNTRVLPWNSEALRQLPRAQQSIWTGDSMTVRRVMTFVKYTVTILDLEYICLKGRLHICHIFRLLLEGCMYTVHVQNWKYRRQPSLQIHAGISKNLQRSTNGGVNAKWCKSSYCCGFSFPTPAIWSQSLA